MGVPLNNSSNGKDVTLDVFHSESVCVSMCIYICKNEWNFFLNILHISFTDCFLRISLKMLLAAILPQVQMRDVV